MNPAEQKTEIPETGNLLSKQVLGADFLQTLYTFIRTAELHEAGNAIFEQPLKLLHRTVQDWATAQGVSNLELQLKGEQFFINEKRIRPKPKIIRKLQGLIRFLRRRGINGFQIPATTNFEDLHAYLWIIQKVQRTDGPTKISEEMRARGLDGFEIRTLNWADGTTAEESASLTEAMYRQLLHFSKSCFTKTHESQIMENAVQMEAILYDLNTISEEDLLQTFCRLSMNSSDTPAAHLAVLSTFLLHLWGKTLGLPPFAVTELAACGLAHPFAFVNMPDGLDPSQLERAQRLSILLQNIENYQKVWPLTDLQILALSEFLTPFGEQGVYQSGDQKFYQHFFSRMLRIAILYIRMIVPDRRRKSLTPSEALQKLLQPDLGCDPSLTKLFVNWLGAYPLGSFVRLSTGEIGQVASVSHDLSQTFRPKIRLLVDKDGKKLDQAKIMDLSEINDRLGIFKSSVQTEMNLEETGIGSEQYQNLMSKISLSTS